MQPVNSPVTVRTFLSAYQPADKTACTPRPADSESSSCVGTSACLVQEEEHCLAQGEQHGQVYLLARQ